MLILIYLITWILLLFYTNDFISFLILLEILLLILSLAFLFISYLFDDLLPSVFILYLIPLAGIESAIGLALLVAYYPNSNHLHIN